MFRMAALSSCVFRRRKSIMKVTKMAKRTYRILAKALRCAFILSSLGILLPLWHASNAYAGPPSWAEAHGYREKHGHSDRHRGKEYDDDDDDDDDEDDDDDDRRGRRARMQPAYAAPYGIEQGTCNRQLLGKVLGGATAAAIGLQVGRGNGQTAAIAGGAIMGAIVGGNIGLSMDHLDQSCVGQILEHARGGTQVAWTDGNNAERYRVTPDRPYRNNQGAYCRNYLTHAVIDGYSQQVSGTACRQPNGFWQMVD
jgi:surface antigen